jgi:hypothetical protein
MRFLKVSGCASAGGVIDSEVGFFKWPHRLNVLDAPLQCTVIMSSIKHTKAITLPTFNVGHHHLAAVDL